MNQNLERLRFLCSQAESVLLTGPLYPDGDSLASCLALQCAIQAISSARVCLSGELSFRYRWLPFSENISAPSSIPDRQFDIAIILDGDRTRLDPYLTKLYDQARHQVIIDHHVSTTNQDYDLFIVDAKAASTTEIIFRLLQHWNIALTPSIATLIYVGIVFDTAGFRYSNTLPQTHIIASELLKTGIDHGFINAKILMERQKSGIQLLGYVLQNTQYMHRSQIALCFIPLSYIETCGASSGDYEGIVETLLFIENIKISCLCIEKDPQKIKVSLRSRCDIDVSKVASKLSPSGGGHHKAAGVLLKTDLSSLQNDLPGFLIEQLQAVYED
ncbi:MAG: bifunctional oligoribonuclease/PAP phosphatase NrnA [Myxococcota bacterium]|nr:bifunctional oligoribonuclease/PAP phosphatase NrnA [Myxococcota bacterium]